MVLGVMSTIVKLLRSHIVQLTLFCGLSWIFLFSYDSDRVSSLWLLSTKVSALDSHVYDSVVKINVYVYDPIAHIFIKKQFGSALIVWTNTLLTNAHVVLVNNEIAWYEVCETRISTKPPVCFGSATLEYLDNQNDLALMKFTNTPSLPVVQLASGNPIIWSDITIFGFWLQGQGNLSASKWIVAWYKGDYFSVDAQINFGDSGGGGFDNKGKLLGVPTFVLLPGEVNGVVAGGYLTPVSTLVSFLSMTQKYDLEQRSIYKGGYGIVSVKPSKLTDNQKLQTQLFWAFLQSKNAMVQQRRIDFPDFSMTINPEFDIHSMAYYKSNGEITLRSKNEDTEFDISTFHFNGTRDELLKNVINNEDGSWNEPSISTELYKQRKKWHYYVWENTDLGTQSRLLIYFDEKTGKGITVNYFGTTTKRAFLLAEKMRSSLKIKNNRKNDTVLALQTGANFLLYQDLNYRMIFTKDNQIKGTLSYTALDNKSLETNGWLALYVAEYLDILDQNDISYKSEQKGEYLLISLTGKPAGYPTHVVFLKKTFGTYTIVVQVDISSPNDLVNEQQLIHNLITGLHFQS